MPSRRLSLTERRAVDRDLGEVRSAQPGQLRVEVREHAGLHQRIVGDLDPRDEVTGMECDLLGLGEIVGGVAVEGHLPYRLTGTAPLARAWSGPASRSLGTPDRRCRASPGSRTPTRGTRRSRCRSRSRRWKSGSIPPSFWDSSQTRPWVPSNGFQWNLTRWSSPGC